jgi:hypothetical protein
MPSLEQRIAEHRAQAMASLAENQRQALDWGNGLDAQQTLQIVLKLTTRLWEALDDVAREIDQLQITADVDEPLS